MTMSVEEAIKRVFDDLDKMSTEQFKAEMEKHRDGDIAVALTELSAFVTDLETTDPELWKKLK